MKREDAEKIGKSLAGITDLFHISVKDQDGILRMLTGEPSGDTVRKEFFGKQKKVARKVEKSISQRIEQLTLGTDPLSHIVLGNDPEFARLNPFIQFMVGAADDAKLRSKEELAIHLVARMDIALHALPAKGPYDREHHQSHILPYLEHADSLHNLLKDTIGEFPDAFIDTGHQQDDEERSRDEWLRRVKKKGRFPEDRGGESDQRIARTIRQFEENGKIALFVRPLWLLHLLGSRKESNLDGAELKCAYRGSIISGWPDLFHPETDERIALVADYPPM